MEHSYSRGIKSSIGINRLSTRTLMVHRPPQCPSCHAHPIEEGIDLDEANHPSIAYNEAAAKESMTECQRIAMSVQNLNSNDEDWEEKVNKLGWTASQDKLFSCITRILDNDRLGRLATIGRPHEPIQRRIIIDKSVQRVRRALASISWDTRLTQWIHGILMDHLPPIYMGMYLDILQTMKSKIPSLVDKMVFGRPMTNNQELLAPVLKKRWDPIISEKERKLPGNVAIVMIHPPSAHTTAPQKIQKWYQLFSSMANVHQINLNSSGSPAQNQTIEQMAEYLVLITRMKVQDLRSEQPNRQIILVGFNAGACVALQVALTEIINSTVCMGFAYHTINGVRGAPDDHILDIKTPIMFVIGQNSMRTSQEEIEAMRERMQSETALLIVGSGDDVLRVPKNKRKLENVTQSMVDNMIIDEVFDFLRGCIINPPGPRQPNNNLGSNTFQQNSQTRRVLCGNANMHVISRKRKLSHGSESIEIGTPSKIKTTRTDTVNRLKTRPFQTSTPKSQLLAQTSNEMLNMAIQSILPEPEKDSNLHREEADDGSQVISSYEVITQPNLSNTLSNQSSLHSYGTSQVGVPIQRSVTTTLPTTQKIKMIPPNQFVQLKPPAQPNAQKIYTIKGSSGFIGTTSPSAGNQVVTVKTGTQFITTKTNQNQIILNPQKFTLLKPGTTIVGNTNATIDKNVNKSQETTQTSQSTQSSTTSTDISCANIFDMPVLFADNEGNIHETAPITAISQQSNTTPIIITQNVSPTKSFVINSGLPKPKHIGKYVYLSRSTLKPTKIVTKPGVPPLNYKVLVNPKSGQTTNIIGRSNIVTDADKQKQQQQIINIQKPKQNENVNITGTVVKTGSASIIGGTGVVSAIAGTSTTSSVSSSNMVGSISTINKSYQPILINMDTADKGQFKNVIKMTGPDGQIKPTIVLKPGGLKTIPAILNPGMRGVTLRKVVNLVPSKNLTTTANVGLGGASDSPKSILVTSSGLGNQITLNTNAAISTTNTVTVKKSEESR